MFISTLDPIVASAITQSNEEVVSAIAKECLSRLPPKIRSSYECERAIQCVLDDRRFDNSQHSDIGRLGSTLMEYGIFLRESGQEEVGADIEHKGIVLSAIYSYCDQMSSWIERIDKFFYYIDAISECDWRKMFSSRNMHQT